MDQREYIRELAKQVKELANTPRMLTLQQEWKEHNALRSPRPMICVSPEGSWEEILPEKSLKCTDPKLRGYEYALRQKLYWGNEIQDDTPISDYFNIPYATSATGYGVEIELDQGENRGSFHYHKMIEDIDRDFHKLKYRQVTYDAQQSQKDLEHAQELFGDILKVRHRGAFWWTLGITSEVIKLIGLEDLMIDMYDCPDSLHRLMAWFRDEHMNLMDQYEKFGILSLNNEDELIASGGIGYTDELPGAGFNGKVGYEHLWGFSESQETVGISPEMFGEFIFPYQLPMLERFGLNCYGCCEPVEGRWEWIQKIPRLRRLSVSPWSNKEQMREILGKNYIFSRKPNPSYVCNGFDRESIEEELRTTMRMAKDLNLEIILKDTHTIENQPERFHEWVKMARQAAEKWG